MVVPEIDKETWIPTNHASGDFFIVVYDIPPDRARSYDAQIDGAIKYVCMGKFGWTAILLILATICLLNLVICRASPSDRRKW
jgi:hypothetical protein